MRRTGIKLVQTLPVPAKSFVTPRVPNTAAFHVRDDRVVAVAVIVVSEIVRWSILVSNILPGGCPGLGS
jgi:hypothetical protein